MNIKPYYIQSKEGDLFPWFEHQSGIPTGFKLAKITKENLLKLNFTETKKNNFKLRDFIVSKENNMWYLTVIKDNSEIIFGDPFKYIAQIQDQVFIKLLVQF